jgi:hypothetical protein
LGRGRLLAILHSDTRSHTDGLRLHARAIAPLLRGVDLYAHMMAEHGTYGIDDGGYDSG